MTAKSNSPNPLNFESDILNEWLMDIQKNPHFKNDPISQLDHLESHSKTLLSQITHTISAHPIPDFSAHDFEPVFKLWHSLLARQSQQGITIRDTAMLIMSLKSSVTHWVTSRFPDQSPPELLSKLNTVLDMLGVLTFEVYTNEKERLIQRQNAHISYLQSAQIESRIGPMIGNSPAIRAVVKAVELILNTNVTVLLEGETGTGKDVIASLIHHHSNRAKKP